MAHVPEHVLQARRAWNKGAPRALSIAQARAEWAAHLPVWGKTIHGNFLGTLGVGPGRGCLGWIDDAAFWSLFWEGRLRDGDVQTTTVYSTEHIRPYIEGAVAAGSVSFFTAMPCEYQNAVDAVLLDTDVLVDPVLYPVLFEQQCVPMWMARQYEAWNRLSWSQGPGKMLGARGQCTTGELIQLTQRAIAADAVHPSRCRSVLGAMLMAVHHTGAKDALTVEHLRGLADAALGEDVELMALCCGHLVRGTPRAQSIVRLGKHLAGTMPLEGTTAGGQEAVNLMGIVQAFSTVQSLEELYNAVRGLGLYPGHGPDAMHVDGGIFDEHEPRKR